MYEHIQIAVDGSDVSVRAEEQGFALAKALGSQVTLVHATEPSICDTDAWPRFISSARNKFGVLLTMAVVLFATSAISTAQEPELGVEPNQAESMIPDVTTGKEIAGKLCVGCHVIEMSSGGNTQADVPSFPSIANRPNQSLEALSGWLMAPHAPMPDPHLARKEIRDLAGYIVSLRGAP